MREPARTSQYRKARRSLPLVLCAALLLSSCALPARPAGETEPAPAPAVTAEPAPAADAGAIRIAELMHKNRATLRDEDGDFSDWVELENCSDRAVDLSGWRLTDRPNREGWTFPTLSLAAGERLLVYADGKDRAGPLHTSFALSAGELLCLYNSRGELADQVLCEGDTADVSLCFGEDGSCRESQYPTPGYPNTAEGYEVWQSSLVPAGPLVINEVLVRNEVVTYLNLVGRSDWVEIRNISKAAVDLSDYCLSDDRDDYCLWTFPKVTLEPGELYVVRCDTEPSEGTATLCGRFALDAAQDELYLARSDGSLVDYVSLRGIPARCSYGRMPGANGWFYFTAPVPGQLNEDGCRRVSVSPTALEPDGVFNGVDSVTVTLDGPGTVRYTLDGTVPLADSPRYTEPLTLTQTAIVRAVSWETGALPSPVATFSYIINENHSLPVVSLVSNDKVTFNGMYYNARKDVETPGSLSFYEEGGSFTIPCGIKMQGGTSLELPKKNLSIRFRGRYGQEKLDYDLFGGGITQFTNLVLRAGQDYFSAIVRNELCQNLALASSDRIMAQRNRYCVLYVDGKYYGIYTLMEKCNEQLYADLYSVSRESVITVEGDSTLNTDLTRDVFDFCQHADMSDSGNYAIFCQRMDVDSLIDWLLLEGYCANSDLTWGNLRFCRSSEGDGKWRVMFYDLDATFNEAALNYMNLFSESQRSSKQISQLAGALMDNADFRDRFLRRAAELLNGPLTDEAVLAELDRLVAQVEPEVPRDYARYQLIYGDWVRHVQQLRQFITENNWRQHNIDTLAKLFRLSAQEKQAYFG